MLTGRQVNRFLVDADWIGCVEDYCELEANRPLARYPYLGSVGLLRIIWQFDQC
jgi:hypothetical protein